MNTKGNLPLGMRDGGTFGMEKQNVEISSTKPTGVA